MFHPYIYKGTFFFSWGYIEMYIILPHLPHSLRLENKNNRRQNMSLPRYHGKRLTCIDSGVLLENG